MKLTVNRDRLNRVPSPGVPRPQIRIVHRHSNDPIVVWMASVVGWSAGFIMGSYL